jgi:hypothetical protein
VKLYAGRGLMTNLDFIGLAVACAISVGFALFCDFLKKLNLMRHINEFGVPQFESTSAYIAFKAKNGLLWVGSWVGLIGMLACFATWMICDNENISVATLFMRMVS